MLVTMSRGYGYTDSGYRSIWEGLSRHWIIGRSAHFQDVPKGASCNTLAFIGIEDDCYETWCLKMWS